MRATWMLGVAEPIMSVAATRNNPKEAQELADELNRKQLSFEALTSGDVYIFTVSETAMSEVQDKIKAN
jgi:hypothetical protein